MRAHKSSRRRGRGFFPATLLAAFLLTALVHPTPGPCAQSDFESVGAVGPKAVELDVTLENGASDKGKPETVVKVRAPKDTHIAALYLPSEGGAVVVIPSREIPDGLLKGGRDYVVFGPGASLRIKAGKKGAGKPKLVFYASAKKLDLDPLKALPDAPCLALDKDDKANLEVLLGKIKGLASDESFNRKIVALDPGAGLIVRLDVMGLPKGAKSRKPTDVLGAPGAKDDDPNADLK
jgi:hypothetical protein